MGLKKDEYALLDYLKEAGSENDGMHDVSQFKIDVIKSLENERYIKTDAKRTQARITGNGLIAHIAEKRITEPVDVFGKADIPKANKPKPSKPKADKPKNGTFQIRPFGESVKPFVEDAKSDILKCGNCNGTGYQNSMSGAWCEICQGKGVIVLDNEDSPEHPTPALPVDGEGVDALEHCDTCAGCVDHEVLHMLAEKYPAIARLRQTVLETRRLMDELGIEKK